MFITLVRLVNALINTHSDYHTFDNLSYLKYSFKYVKICHTQPMFSDKANDNKIL